MKTVKLMWWLILGICISQQIQANSVHDRWVLRAFKSSNQINAVIKQDTFAFSKAGDSKCLLLRGDFVALRRNKCDSSYGPKETCWISTFSEGCFNGEGWVPPNLVQKIEGDYFKNVTAKEYLTLERTANFLQSARLWASIKKGKGWHGSQHYIKKGSFVDVLFSK